MSIINIVLTALATVIGGALTLLLARIVEKKCRRE
jgi:hypothetical protein